MANEKFQKALKGEEQSCPPVWFMRQAGRYHTHYQNLRTQHGFKELCKNPELAAEVAYGPMAEFDFDVSILFSDILFPLEALGMGLEYSPGPTFDRKITPENVAQLKSADEAIESLQFQAEALKMTRERLPENKSLIGFVGAPWTLFTYAVEGSHSGNMIESKTNLALIRPIFDKLIPLLKRNIQLQLDAGAELVMLFDTSSGNLSPSLFEQAVMPGLGEISSEFPGQLGYYSKGIGTAQLALLQKLSLAGLGYDHRFELAEILKGNEKGFVQGNFDQSLLFSDSADFDKAFDQYVRPIKALNSEQRRWWVSGLGHGVLPKTPEQNVKRFVQRIRDEFSG